jgi:sulfate permease, SulP family
MTVYGMDAAMITGVLTAIFTFVAQNMTYVDPLRGVMSAATLRSDVWNRHHDALSILENVHTGRSRILVIQLQGNLFFGNMAHFTKAVTELLQRTQSTRTSKKEVAAMPSIAEDKNDSNIRCVGSDDDSFQEHPLVVILDFSLVLGIDSSAAQALTRLKNSMREQFYVELSIFVSGSPNGFPCAVDLSKELTTVADAAVSSTPSSSHWPPDESTCLLQDEHILKSSSFHQELEALLTGGSQVAETLNLALAYAENFLIARENPDLLDAYTMAYTMTTNTEGARRRQLLPIGASLSDEHEVAIEYLNRLSPQEVERQDCETLFSRFERETYHQGEFVWKQGSKSSSIKLLLQGTLISILENEAGTNETISAGNTIGELGVMTDIPRLSSIQCLTDEAIVYSLSREAYHELLESSPHVARLLDMICIRYLSARVQHVSNRIFETRCLPI